MLFDKKLFNFILKLGIHTVKKEHGCLSNFNNFIVGQKKNISIVNLDYTVLTTYQIFLFMYRLSKNNGKLLFIERLDKFGEIFESVSSSTSQRYIEEESWIEGTLTNFTRLKWEHLLKGVDVGNRLPDIVVIFDNSWFDNLLIEVSREKLPILGTLKFSDQDKFLSYYILGGFNTYDSVYFFCKVLSLAIFGGKGLKLKYLFTREDFRKLRRKPRRRRKLLKKMKWARLFRKNVERVPRFRADQVHSLRRYQLTRNVFHKYYDSQKATNRGYLMKARRKISKKLEFSGKKISSITQIFIARYETRLSSILYRLGVCKNVNVAKVLIHAKNVYVNNIPIFDKNFFIKPGDIIQLNLKKCKPFQLISFLKRIRKIRRRVPRKWRRKSRIFFRSKTRKKLRSVLRKVPLKKTVPFDADIFKGRADFPIPFKFYEESSKSALLDFYKKENCSKKLWNVIQWQLYLNQMVGWENFKWVTAGCSEPTALTNQLETNSLNSIGLLSSVTPNRVFSVNLETGDTNLEMDNPYKGMFGICQPSKININLKNASFNPAYWLSHTSKIGGKIQFVTLQKKNWQNSQKVVKALILAKNKKNTKPTAFSIIKTVYKNATRRLKKNKKNSRKVRKTKKVPHKLLRKAGIHTPFRRPRFSWVIKRLKKKNRKFSGKNFMLENSSINSLPGLKLAKEFRRLSYRYFAFKYRKLLNEKCSLSPFKKPGLKAKRITQVRGKPWWFNREKDISLKLFSWKKKLVGQRSKIWVQPKYTIFFFNRILKRKQQKQSLKIIPHFKRMVLSYRMLQIYNSKSAESLKERLKLFSLSEKFWWMGGGKAGRNHKKKKKLHYYRKKLKAWKRKKKRGYRIFKIKNLWKLYKKYPTHLKRFSKKKIIQHWFVNPARPSTQNKKHIYKIKNKVLKHLYKVKKLYRFKKKKKLTRKLNYLGRRRRYGHYGVKLWRRYKKKKKLKAWKRKKRLRKKKKWKKKKWMRLKIRKKRKGRGLKRRKKRRRRIHRFLRWRMKKRQRRLIWKNGVPYKGPLLKTPKSYPRNFFFNRKYCVGVYTYTPNTKKIPFHSRMLTLKRLKILANS